MDMQTMTLEELIDSYQSFLEKNLSGREVTKIADKIQKSPKTIYNYLGRNNYIPKDLLTMRAIIESALEILENRGVIYA